MLVDGARRVIRTVGASPPVSLALTSTQVLAVQWSGALQRCGEDERRLDLDANGGRPRQQVHERSGTPHALSRARESRRQALAARGRGERRKRAPRRGKPVPRAQPEARTRGDDASKIRVNATNARSAVR